MTVVNAKDIFLDGAAGLRAMAVAFFREGLATTARMAEENFRLKEENRRLAERVAQLEHYALTDPLTGLYNRRGAEGHYRQLLSYLEREEVATVGMVLADLDNFKSVNDTYGHPTGDALLKHTAEGMRESCRSGDILCRLGGDEFLIMLPNHRSEDEVLLVAEKLRVVTRKRFDGYGVSLSIGALCLDVDKVRTWLLPEGDLFEFLLESMDMALYASKKRGKDAVTKVEPYDYDRTDDRSFFQGIEDLLAH
jgi:diguanylate cyclase (GGDEF)-like protein